ncbi:MAG: porin [Alphaproteobacteria bacterium]|nr:porin [Alphaproteobacteria bacterium]
MRAIARTLLATASALALTGVAAAASNEEILQRLDAMQRTIEAQQAQIEAQRAEIDSLKKRTQKRGAGPQSAADAGVPPPAPFESRVAALEAEAKRARIVAKEQPSVSLVNGRPTIQSSDGRFSATIRGRLQFDLASYDQDSAGSQATDFRRGSVGTTANREIVSARDLSDGGNFRRAQIGVEGKLAKDFGYRVVLEMGGSGTEGPSRLNEGWISYTGLAPFTFQVGAFSPPANLDDATSSDDTMFIERASPAELSRALAGADGRYAVGARANGERWFAALHLTGGTFGDAETFDEQRAVIARVAGLAATGSDYNLHVGANLSYVFKPADQGPDVTARSPVRLRDRPELRVDSTRLIDTGSINADSVYAAGAELAGNWKNLNFQAEYFWYGVNRRDSTLSDPRFQGWYAEGSWIVTGEQKRYSMANASYAMPRPAATFQGSSGIGAVELAVRYSHTDLNYREGAAGTLGAADSIRGGEQDIWTLGANWYWNQNLRFTLGYQFVDVDRLNPARVGDLTPFGPSPATPPVGAEIGQSYRVLSLRSQVSF